MYGYIVSRYYLLNTINVFVIIINVSYVFMTKRMNDSYEIWYGDNWDHKKGHTFKKK